MTVSEFLTDNMLSAECINARHCVTELLEAMEQGLAGEGNIPMLPSFLPARITPPRQGMCCVLDAGGTNLRSARAVFDEGGACRVEDIATVPLPGTRGVLTSREFYSQMAAQASRAGGTERVGLCFSFNVILERHLDGILQGWCKEVQVPEAVGQPVGAALRACLGDDCTAVHVLNDSVAAMVGAAGETEVKIGLILGTGINVCYEELCGRIPKVPRDLAGDRMVISTEVGEFDGIPKSPYDLALFAGTEDPALAHAEKQCAGGYLGDLICRVWNGAAEERLLDSSFRDIRVSLVQISAMLSGEKTDIPVSEEAGFIAETLIHRAAKIAAILTAAPILRCTKPGEQAGIAVEGSQFYKLAGFRSYFEEELTQILGPHDIAFRCVSVANACLKGAALAAFAPKM